jgi:hypothetical protein
VVLSAIKRGTLIAPRHGALGMSFPYVQLFIQASSTRRPSARGASDHVTAA